MCELSLFLMAGSVKIERPSQAFHRHSLSKTGLDLRPCTVLRPLGRFDHLALVLEVDLGKGEVENLV